MSPSRTITRAVVAGGRYRVDELLRRAREALEAGSERVRERYGFACTAAAAQIVELERAGARYAGDAEATVEAVRVAPPRAPLRGARADRRPPRGRRDRRRTGGPRSELGARAPRDRARRARARPDRQRLARAALGRVLPRHARTGSARCPGIPTQATDPDGFMLRDDIVEYVESYASRFSPPVMEGVEVTARDPRRRRVPRGDEPRRADRRRRRARRRRLPPREGAAGSPSASREASRSCTPRRTATRPRCPTAASSSSGRASRAPRSPRISTSPGATCTCASGRRRGWPASTAGATASPGCTTAATTGCRSTSTRRGSRRARRPTTT